MKINELFNRKIAKKVYGKAAVILAGGVLLTLGALSQKYCLGQNYFLVTVNNKTIGAVDSDVNPDEELKNCRRILGNESQTPVCLDLDYSYEEKHEFFTRILAEAEFEETLLGVLREEEEKNTLISAYTVSIGDFSASFSTLDDVKAFLNDAKASYDENGLFEAVFTEGDDHESNSMQAVLESKEVLQEATTQEEAETGEVAGTAEAGVALAESGMIKEALENPDGNYYETGILDVDYASLVEVYSTLTTQDGLSDLAEAVAAVTKEEETNKIYEVEAGDCLSTIAEKFGLKLARLCELNGFTDTNQSIYIDQELIVAVPEPDLSISVQEGIVYEEDYTADPTIIPNDSWYTTDSVTLQEGVTGHREVNAVITYVNGIETGRETAHTTVMTEAVPAVVEQGTIIPPTYIKPISGGRFTSGFGRRWGRMHKGVDWACPIGTTIFASSDGVVEYAGWSSGYGYNVLIDHPDGRKTRYAHMSKTLVSAGQSVSQGQTIGLSGSTGRSTGPHVHFEIIINGSQVNPLDYVN